MRCVFRPAVKMSQKRQRKANYSQEENLFLSEKYEEFKDIIDAKQKDVNTNRKKKEAWENILTQHRARFLDTERSLDDLKCRLTKLKSESREIAQQQKKSRAKTGGGKLASAPNPAQQKMLDLCADTPGFQGLTGVESGVTAKSVAQDDLLSESDSSDVHVGELLSNVHEIDTPKPSSSKSATRVCCSPPSSKKLKKDAAYNSLIETERENMLIKRQNLLLKQEKLKLQIELLKRQLHDKNPASLVQTEEGSVLLKL